MRSALAEVVAATAVMALLLAIGEWSAASGEVGAQVGGLLVAAGFIGVPLAVARWNRRNGDVLAVDPPLWPAIALGAITAAVVLPMYALGFDVWHVHVLAKLRVPHWPEIGAVAENMLVQVGAVALPEELFFRGYVLGRLRDQWPAQRQVLGVPFGLAAVISAALFAAVHLVAVPAPFRLLVFFPGLLFGWVALRSGSAISAAVLHALCNVALSILTKMYV
ncbi:MAG: CPBP family intramembrane metalloprotease [Myxococcales bacterium]|nr:CPBP family intramembrane metalloprotease [Myxococcales bacterium]